MDRNASKEDNKRAYRKLASSITPTVTPATNKSEEKFKEVNEAYQVLSDKEKRSRYDQLGDSYSNWQQAGARRADSTARSVPAAAAWWCSRRCHNLDDPSAVVLLTSSIPFSAAWAALPLGGELRQPVEPSQMQPVTISCRKPSWARCVPWEVNGRRFEVKIPAGAKTDTKVRIPAAGMDDGRGNRSDIYLLITISPDNRFELKGNELHTEVTIDMISAVPGWSGRRANPVRRG